MHDRRLIAPVVATLGIAFAAAGCGGGAGSPQVASLGGTGSTATPPAGAPAGSTSGPSAGGSSSLILKTQDGVKFSQCMRSHGVPGFPDPSSQGTIHVTSAAGIDPASARFQAALHACQALVRGGTARPSAAQIARMKAQALHFSACMRSHGVPDFPDPTFSSSGGGIAMKLTASKGDLNPSSPAFRAALKACQGKGGPLGAVAAG